MSLSNKELSRRTFVRSTLVGLAGGAATLAGCGSQPSAPDRKSVIQPTPPSEQIAPQLLKIIDANPRQPFDQSAPLRVVVPDPLKPTSVVQRVYKDNVTLSWVPAGSEREVIIKGGKKIYLQNEAEIRRPIFVQEGLGDAAAFSGIGTNVRTSLDVIFTDKPFVDKNNQPDVLSLRYAPSSDIIIAVMISVDQATRNAIEKWRIRTSSVPFISMFTSYEITRALVRGLCTAVGKPNPEAEADRYINMLVSDIQQSVRPSIRPAAVVLRPSIPKG